MRIAEINMISYGSTGKIMLQIAKCARQYGHLVQTYSTNTFNVKYKKNFPAQEGHFYYGTYFENGVHYALGSLFGRNGEFSVFGTQQLINSLKKFNPDIIHLHNLHNFCICFPMLFNYIKKNNIKVVWTFHDCWAFTGQCPHFEVVQCEKWKNGCYGCPQLDSYPKSRIDNSKNMYRKKKEWFTGIKDLTVVTPSKWLSDLVKQSFFKEYPVKIINNGIDLSIFKPVKNNFREKYNCQDEYILLGVSFGWGKRKGLDVFIELSKRLSDKYRIVLVGTDENVDKQLPDNIISIHQTQNQKELAEIYSTADLFVNPTREENYPTVNMESIACGTPVVTFNTGGSAEILDKNCGSVVKYNDIDALEKEILYICENKPYSLEACLKRAEYFDMNNKFKEYVDLYEDVLDI